MLPAGYQSMAPSADARGKQAAGGMFSRNSRVGQARAVPGSTHAAASLRPLARQLPRLRSSEQGGQRGPAPHGYSPAQLGPPRSARCSATGAVQPTESAALPSRSGPGEAPLPASVAGGLSSVATAERVPVETALTSVVGTAPHVPGALALLRAALLRAQADPSRPHFNSGLLRLEVALPRGSDPLAWLRALPATDAALMPQAFFAPRATPPVPSGDLTDLSLDAPPTRGPGDGATLVAVAGAGAARLWRAPSGSRFDADACARLRRFVAAGAARARALGGMRFDTARPASPEWAPFGGYFLVLPLLELTEGPHACVLAATVAWDQGNVSAPHEHETGFRTFADAAAAALAAVSAAERAAAASGAALAPLDTKLGACVSNRTHLPDEQGWTDTVTELLSDLGRSRQADDSPVVGAAAMEALERLAASNGGEVAQQVLSGALDSAVASAASAAAVSGSPAASSSFSSASVSGASVSDGRSRGGAALAALGDLARSASGRKALEELAGRSGGSADPLEELEEVARAGRRSAQLATLESLASERAFAAEDEDRDPVPLEALTGPAPVGDDDDLLSRAAALAAAGTPANGAGGSGRGGSESARADSGVGAGAAAEAAADALDVAAADAQRDGASGPLTKVVMARRTELELSSDLDPFSLVSALRRRNPGAYAFALCLPNGEGSFVGATPERLFAIEGAENALNLPRLANHKHTAHPLLSLSHRPLSPPQAPRWRRRR